MTATRAIVGLLWSAVCLSAANQPQISVLTIEVDNVVTYVGDVTDPSKLALSPAATTPAATRAFTDSIIVADVVKVNGKPAKGLWSSRSYGMGFSPTAASGFAISDASGALGECRWEIQTADGVLVGRFMEGGLGMHQISAGSGAFFGLRGQQTRVQTVRAFRRASMTEDPSLRRVLGGGYAVHTFHVATAYPAAFAGSDTSPEVFHADFTLVNAGSPAHAGEVLIGRVSNLGYTTPANDPGAAFPTSAPYDLVNAPVEVVVGGQAQDAINKEGWPGLVNLYRVDFVVPPGTHSGMVDVQLSVSGIAGPAVQIPVQ
ncbi:MAG TPA: hypothetical protein VLY24_09555 [Bryobacteraceae bacterium]|nr:hypothetical protein [Bryobacteraceae bacterium]